MSTFPRGWDEKRVQRVLDHYEHLSEAEFVAEDEAVISDRSQSVIEVPRDLVPEIRQLIARYREAHP